MSIFCKAAALLDMRICGKTLLNNNNTSFTPGQGTISGKLLSAKCRIYRYFVQVGLGVGIADPLIAWKRTWWGRLPG
ncbi:hypothetical protein LAZ67_5001140 [Cordylochernes scorpioides]|uniref:Uncharacterized protein n=1 Tax=Cordylochernes scorpioides TaxID=51811 RepID=A0ABY6KFJ8_9ARAC|nr:hypothetical protein LAZ67_5001140 [Cordylochernes scorpioides]